MCANTIAQNQSRNWHGGGDQQQEIWLFGYGSLIYHADFPFVDRCPGYIKHWVRRFWQGSHDHRGTPDAPGRVVTLIAEPEAACHGMAYLISPSVFAHLDYREKNGYLRESVPVYFADGSCENGVVYIAPQNNEAFLGPASELDIARQISLSAGPSGPNKDYLFDLANALRKLPGVDPHIFAIERHLTTLQTQVSE